ncbi:MAG: hypothetical protein LIP77_04460, partial [Planctomycetes bacterium]|nr:hypothetical protein [Planctomycetota bacterium]
MADKETSSTARASAHASSRANASIRGRALGQIPATLQSLNALDSVERKTALLEAASGFEQGLVTRPHDTGWVNVLARTFFSYSVDSLSPARLAWEAAIRGMSVIGSADRDNLGALGEMLSAGDALSIRTTVSLETKTFVLSYADRDINYPGQPGFLRALGVGFSQVPALDSDHGRLLAALPNRARDRNQALVEKLNTLLAPVAVDYAQDVMPLTPAGNATEDHISSAYANKARGIFSEFHDLVVFWGDVLGRSPADIECLMSEPKSFMEVLSEKLMRMGADDAPRSSAEFPSVTEFFQAVKASGAIPCLYWRDGESEGEANPHRLLDDALNWGARAVAVNPDRSWNVADPAVKKTKLAALADLVAAARERHLPILSGSPMNAPRQKFVDSFDAPEIAPFFRDFTDSAFWLYGHSVLERAGG